MRKMRATTYLTTLGAYWKEREPRTRARSGERGSRVHEARSSLASVPTPETLLHYAPKSFRPPKLRRVTERLPAMMAKREIGRDNARSISGRAAPCTYLEGALLRFANVCVHGALTVYTYLYGFPNPIERNECKTCTSENSPRHMISVSTYPTARCLPARQVATEASVRVRPLPVLGILHAHPAPATASTGGIPKV